MKEDIYKELPGNGSPLARHICREVIAKRTTKVSDRDNLEWLVNLSLSEGIISISRGRELLGFPSMEEMREWLFRQDQEDEK